METDIFTRLETDPQGGGDPGAEFAFGGEGTGQTYEVEGTDPTKAATPPAGTPEGSKEGEAPKPDDVVQVKREDWDRTQQVLAEFKGFMAAKQAGTGSEQAARPQYDPQQEEARRAMMTQQQAQFDQFLDSLAEDVTSLDPKRAKAALQKAIAAGAQLGAQAAMQSITPAHQTTADLMVENYITRKSAKDPDAYEKISERFEQKLAQIDPRTLAGYSRAQLNIVLDELYDAELGRWAREQLQAASERRKQAPAATGKPTNYGGGRSAAAPATRSAQIPQAWIDFAKQSGIPEDQITPELFQNVNGNG